MAVVQLASRCWIVKEYLETPADRAYPEPSPHFASLREAMRHYDDIRPTLAALTQWDQPCWVAKCDACGKVLGDGGELDEAHYDCEFEAARNGEYQDDHCEEDI